MYRTLKEKENLIRDLKAFGEKMLENPELAKEQLIKAGINNPDGSLSKNYK